MKSLFNKIRNWFSNNDKIEIYPTLDPHEKVYEFFQRMKPYEKLIKDKIDWFSRSNNLYGRIKE